MKYSEFLAAAIAQIRATASVINNAAKGTRRTDPNEANELSFEADQLEFTASVMEKLNTFTGVIGDDVVRFMSATGKPVRILITSGERVIRDMEVKPE